MSKEELVNEIIKSFNSKDEGYKLSIEEEWNPVETKLNSHVKLSFHYKNIILKIAACDIISNDRELFFDVILMQVLQGHIEEECRKSDLPKPYLDL